VTGIRAGTPNPGEMGPVVRVLIAEDSPTQAALLVELLRARGYTTQTVLSLPSDVLSALEVGVDSHIPRPYRDGYVVDRIAEVLSCRGHPQPLEQGSR
jgi:DNA-binding response OmpR family regulator